MLYLSFQQLSRHLGLNQIVNASAATAPRTFRQFYQLEVGYCFQQRAGLIHHSLPMGEVTRLVVSDELGWGLMDWRFDANFRQPFVYIFYFLVPEIGAFAVEGIVRKEFGVMF